MAKFLFSNEHRFCKMSASKHTSFNTPLTSDDRLKEFNCTIVRSPQETEWAAILNQPNLRLRMCLAPEYGLDKVDPGDRQLFDVVHATMASSFTQDVAYLLENARDLRHLDIAGEDAFDRGAGDIVDGMGTDDVPAAIYTEVAAALVGVMRAARPEAFAKLEFLAIDALEQAKLRRSVDIILEKATGCFWTAWSASEARFLEDSVTHCFLRTKSVIPKK